MHNSHFQILINSGILGYVTWLMMFLPVVFLSAKLFLQSIGNHSFRDRYQIELFMVVLLLVGRTLTGSGLANAVPESMVFLAIYVYLKLSRRPAPQPQRKMKAALSSEAPH